MDSSLTIKPRPGVAPRSYALRDPVTVRETIDTELDPSKTVNPAGDGGSRQHNTPHHDAHTRDPVIDPASQAALISAIDMNSEQQSPNQALMRQRAYQHLQTPKEPHAENTSAVDPHADIEA